MAAETGSQTSVRVSRWGAGLVLICLGGGCLAWSWDLIWPAKSAEADAEVVSELKELERTVPREPAPLQARIISVDEVPDSQPAEVSPVVFHEPVQSAPVPQAAAWLTGTIEASDDAPPRKDGPIPTFQKPVSQSAMKLP